MTTPEFKKIARLLKLAYTKLEEQAMEEGVDMQSAEFLSLIDTARANILAKGGFTDEEYEEAKETYLASRKAEKEASDVGIKAVLEKVSMVKGEQGDSGPSGIEGPQGPQGPQGPMGPSGPQGRDGRDGLDGKDGKDGKPGKDGRDGRDGIDADPLLVKSLSARLATIPTEEAMAEKIKEEVGYGIKAATEIMGMPNWRKLAMGLQGQIDVLSSLVIGSSGFNVETPSGTVNGVNVTFTVGNTPKAVIIDGLYKVDGSGYTYSGGTITVDSDAPPLVYIRSIY